MEYRLPKLKDKKLLDEYIAEHNSYNEKHLSASNMLTSMKWEDWVKKINSNAKVPDKEWGKSLTYLAFDNNKLIGLLSIRYDLPQSLVDIYGHIGYGVRPTERRKGYALKMLKYALEECKELGMDSVILGCYKDNIGSVKTITNNNGNLIREEENRQYYEIKL